MARFLKSRKKSHGAVPGSLIFIGDKKIETPEIRYMLYDKQNLEERQIASPEEIPGKIPGDSVLWVNLYGLQDTALIEQLGKHFSIPALEMEDIVNTDQRPKIIENQNNLTFFLKIPEFREKTGEVNVEQLSIVLGKNYVVTFQERLATHFEPIRNRIRKKIGRVRERGADYLAYTIIDTLVDGYMHTIEDLGSTMENMESEVLHHTKKATLEKIYQLKTCVGTIRKAILPLREMMIVLNKSGMDLIEERTRIFLKDLNDLTTQALEAVEIYHNMAVDYLNIYHTNVSNRTNAVMKVLTIFASIFIPLTFIAGVYGTNFDYLPELHYKYSYFIMWGVMVIIAIAMLIFFRRKGWL